MYDDDEGELCMDVCVFVCMSVLPFYLLFTSSVRLINHHHPRRRIYHQLPSHQEKQVVRWLERYRSK